jgi:hypothetical protein
MGTERIFYPVPLTAVAVHCHAERADGRRVEIRRSEEAKGGLSRCRLAPTARYSPLLLFDLVVV